MQISNLKKDRMLMEFDVKGVDVAFVNGLRRTITTDIPITSIFFDPTASNNDDIKFIVNTSCFHNEFLGQRISLIPLHFNSHDIDTFLRDNYKFVLHEKNTSDEIMDITTDHIKIYNNEGVLYSKEIHQKIFPHDHITKDPILITKLKQNLYDKSHGEELHFEAWASIGTVRTKNIGFSPICQCHYYAITDEDEEKEGREKYLTALKKAYEDKKLPPPSEKALADATKDFNALNIQRCFKKNEYGEPLAFHFAIESVCGLTPQNLIHRALDVLAQKMYGLSDKVTIRKADNGGFSLMIDGINHTQGGHIQSYMYDKMVDSGILTFVGYNMPHPHEEVINLRLMFKDTSHNEDYVMNLFKDICNEIGDHLLKMKPLFNGAN